LDLILKQLYLILVNIKNQTGFYTDGIKDENSERWYWETTGAAIAEDEFHWAAGRPNMVTRPLSCIFIMSGYGNGDHECRYGYDGVICE
jgi:hypothetical protein